MELTAQPDGLSAQKSTEGCAFNAEDFPDDIYENFLPFLQWNTKFLYVHQNFCFCSCVSQVFSVFSSEPTSSSLSLKLAFLLDKTFALIPFLESLFLPLDFAYLLFFPPLPCCGCSKEF
jgi:hypothetical protein